MLNNIDLNKFRTFRSVAHTESIRKAAEELCLSPSAVSQSISALERQLGVRLFERTGKRILLNPTGQQILDKYACLEDSFARGLVEVLSEQKSIEGIVRVGGYLEFTKTELQSKISEFFTKFPNIQLKFFFNSPSGLEKLLEESKIDLAFSIFPHRRSESFISSPIFTEELVLIASKLNSSPLDTIAAISTQPIIDYYQSHIVFDRWLEHHFQTTRSKSLSSRMKIRAFAGTAEMVLSFVAQNIGIGVVPRYLTESTQLREKIRIISPSANELQDNIWLIEPLVNRNSYTRKSAIQCFRSHILEKEWIQ